MTAATAVGSCVCACVCVFPVRIVECVTNGGAVNRLLCDVYVNSDVFGGVCCVRRLLLLFVGLPRRRSTAGIGRIFLPFRLCCGVTLRLSVVCACVCMCVCSRAPACARRAAVAPCGVVAEGVAEWKARGRDAAFLCGHG